MLKLAAQTARICVVVVYAVYAITVPSAPTCEPFVASAAWFGNSPLATCALSGRLFAKRCMVLVLHPSLHCDSCFVSCSATKNSCESVSSPPPLAAASTSACLRDSCLRAFHPPRDTRCAGRAVSPTTPLTQRSRSAGPRLTRLAPTRLAPLVRQTQQLYTGHR